MIEKWKSEATIDEFGCVQEGCDLLVERLCNLINVPDSEAVKDKLRNMDNSRPRLIEKADKIKSVKGKNAFNARIYEKLKAYADELVKKPVCVPSEFKNNLMFAREVLDRCFILGFFYQNESQEYKDSLIPQLEEALKLYNSLDLRVSDAVLPKSELSVAFSIAYDWINDGLGEELKKEIREAIKANAEIAVSYYTAPIKANAAQVNNWNAVFSGSNIVTALAMQGDEDTDLWERLLDGAVRSITLPLSEYAPNGGYPEGPGYWQYQAQYVVYALSSLESALGTDFNLKRMPGFEKAAYEPIYLHSSDFKAFNFSDSGATLPTTSFMHWFGKSFGVDEVYSYGDAVRPNGTDFSGWEGNHYDLMILFFREDSTPGLYTKLPTSYCFGGRQQFMTLRSSWDKGAAFLGFKGGYNQLPHCNLDIGTFVYDWNGIRWFCELGGEDYSAGGYWDFSYGRWQYYTQRAEGHNTIVINPTGEADQNIYATSTVKKQDENSGIVDIKDAYPDLESGERHFALEGKEAVITDTLKLKKKSDIYWFMHSDATLNLIDEKTVRLTRGTSQVEVTFDLPEGAVLSLMDAKPLVKLDSGNSGLTDYRKICVKMSGEGEIVLKTRIKPIKP